MLNFKVLFLIIGFIVSHYECIVNPCKKGLGNQFFSHPDSPSQYIQCSQWGQMFVFSCPEGLVWNLERTSCERKNWLSFFQSKATTASIAQDLFNPVTNPVRNSNILTTTRTTFETRLPTQSIAQTNTVTNVARNNNILTTTRTTFETSLPTQPIAQTNPVTNLVRNNNILTTTRTTLDTRFQTQPIAQTLFTEKTTKKITETTVLIQTTTIRPILTTTSATTTTAKILTSEILRQENKTPGTSSTKQNLIETKDLDNFSFQDCSVFSISNSMVPVINGIYSRLNSDVYRRSDNLRIPGLIVNLGQSQWCISLSFSAHDLDSISISNVKAQCGTNLECCMLISRSTDNLELTNSNREWTINILENKNRKDSGIKMSCQNIKKPCMRVPFCPPECHRNVDGCDVCECDGKPFFKIVNPMNMMFTQVSTNNQKPAALTQTNPKLPNQSKQQKLLSLSNSKNEDTTQLTEPINNPSTIQLNETFIVTTCDKVKCPTGLICAIASGCNTCNPMCFPKDKIDLAHGFKPSCENTICPSGFSCLLEDNTLKCVQSKLEIAQPRITLVQPTKEELEIEELVKLHDTSLNSITHQPITTVTLHSTTTPITPTTTRTTTKTTTTITSTSTISTTITTTHQTATKISNLNSLQNILQPINQQNHQGGNSHLMNMIQQQQVVRFPIRFCSMVQCPTGLVCAEARSCATCNPMCFPPNKFELPFGVKLTCENVKCPSPLKCTFDSSENNLKCIL